MNIKEFAEKYKLKTKKDSCDDLIIVGRLTDKGSIDRPEAHHHIYEVDGAFFAYFNFPTVGRWNGTRRKLQAQGLKCVRNCMTEGVFLFDAGLEPVVKVVLKTVGCRVKRQMSEEQRAKLKARFARA